MMLQSVGTTSRNPNALLSPFQLAQGSTSPVSSRLESSRVAGFLGSGAQWPSTIPQSATAPDLAKFEIATQWLDGCHVLRQVENPVIDNLIYLPGGGFYSGVSLGRRGGIGRRAGLKIQE